jgi:hypothetical protein
MTTRTVQGRVNLPTLNSIVVGFSVTIYTPSHAQIVHLPDTLHSLNRTMAGLALHALVHMRPMVEVNKIR